jgi:spermidine/putrescine transport system substrate-binding protein
VTSGSQSGAQDDVVTLTRAAFVRRLVLAGVSATILADWSSACSRATFAPSGSTLPPTPTPSPTGAVQLLAPSGIIDPSVLRAFSQRTGVAVRAAAPAEGVTLSETLRGGTSCDVVLAPDDLVTVLAGERLLLPLDMTLVGNFDYVQGAFRAPPYDHGDLARYSVPFQFKTLGLAVRRDALDDAPRAWADLWRPRFRGGVRVDARGHSVIGMGLLSLGFPLGSTDRREIRLAVARLIALKANLQEPGLDTGGAAATVCWSPQALRAIRAVSGRSLRFVLPAEGFEIDTDTLCVPRATSNSPAAHAFLDFCLRPSVQRRLSERLGTQSAEPEAWRYLPSLERSFARSDLQLAHGQWLADLGSFGAVYDKAWATVAREWGLAA